MSALSFLDKMISDLELVTEIAAMVPSPIAPFATLALKLEQVGKAAITAQAASSGKTVDEILAGLKQEPLVPDPSKPATPAGAGS